MEEQLTEERLAALYQVYKESQGVGSDTRKLASNQVFFALKGPNFDGNQFVQQALNQEAAAVVIDDPGAQVNEERVWLVEDSLRALQQLAHYHRQLLSCPIVGLTGSNGKTTTKELATRMIQGNKKVFTTPGNYNNHIGLPLALLQIQADVEWAILEMGDNQAGDIQELSYLAEPDYGLITNIGKDHIGFYADMEANAKGKLELFDYILERKGRFLLNADDTWLRDWMAGQDLNVLAYSICDPWASMMGAFSANQMDGIEVRLDFPSGEQIFIKTQLHGSFHLYNILAAATIAWEAGSTPGQIKEAAETYRPSNNRSELRTLADGRKVLLDAYNANPTSMQMALENASEVVDGSWAVVLGDMLELGEHSEFEHKILGQLVKRLGPDPVILIGPAMKTAAKEIPDERVYWFPNTETARGTIATLLDGCPFILMKGSRSLAVEGLVDQLEASE